MSEQKTKEPDLRQSLRVIVGDCQDENPSNKLLLSQFQESLRMLEAKCAKELKDRRSKEAWDDWRDATQRLKAVADDPIPHAIIYLQEMQQGEAS
jgi:hypothetical protein